MQLTLAVKPRLCQGGGGVVVAVAVAVVVVGTHSVEHS